MPCLSLSITGRKVGSVKEPSIFVGGRFEVGRDMSSRGRGEKEKGSRMGTRLSIGGAEKREDFHFAVIGSKTCLVVMGWVRFAFERERGNVLGQG